MYRVEYDFEVLHEDTEVRHNAMDSGDIDFDHDHEDWIIAELERGNIWAWCMILVTARINDIRGTERAACCSYRDEEEFRKSEDHGDMKRCALNELRAKLAEMHEATLKIVNFNREN